MIVELAFASALLAQSMSMPMPPPASLETNLGDEHFRVTTKNAEAQRFFDQGLRYTFAFNHDAAVASFKHAAELDPDLALAYWGQALALGPNINLDIDADREKQAYELIQAAKQHATNASQKERDMIEVLARRYSNDPNADLTKLSSDYANAMRDLHKKYPDDPHIATLFAESLMDLHPWKLWTHDGQPSEVTNEVVGVLESVLKAHPNHIGANHYYIHAVEASPHPERALASARRLESAAPAAGHLVHMPAHIYQRTGNYTGAAAANQAGAHADRAYMKKYGDGGMYPLMYFNHNLDFGSMSYAMAGQFDEAKRFADEVTANAIKIAKDIPPIEPFATGSTEVLMRFGKWADVLRAPDQTAGPLSSMFRHYARGVAFARLGNIEGARSEQRAFEKERTNASEETGFLQNSAKSLMAVASPLLEGQVAAASGDLNAAIASYRRAVEAEDKLNYDEPADWYYPTRETLGAALLRNGNAAEAERVFRDDLARTPNNPRSLFGLAEALKAQKKPSATTAAAFKKAWRGGPLRIEDL